MPHLGPEAKPVDGLLHPDACCNLGLATKKVLGKILQGSIKCHNCVIDHVTNPQACPRELNMS